MMDFNFANINTIWLLLPYAWAKGSWFTFYNHHGEKKIFGSNMQVCENKKHACIYVVWTSICTFGRCNETFGYIVENAEENVEGLMYYATWCLWEAHQRWKKTRDSENSILNLEYL